LVSGCQAGTVVVAELEADAAVVFNLASSAGMVIGHGSEATESREVNARLRV